MPGIATHHIFGCTLYRLTAEALIGTDASIREAFLLGNQGPDPLFYAVVLPIPNKARGIGRLMHRARTAELLDAMHQRFIVRGDMACRAYALGFLCHYFLDSSVHPLVYAQQKALALTGIEGLSKQWTGRIVHATIETEIDEYMLTTRYGATAATFPPHKIMLNCPTDLLKSISEALSDTILRVYGLEVPADLLVNAVNLNRTAQLLYDSRSGGVRRKFDYLGFAGMPSAYGKALSHSSEPRTQTAFSNADHIAWPHPSIQGQTVSSSFDELYEQALETAQDSLPLFSRPDLPSSFCETLVNGTNFLGRSVT